MVMASLFFFIVLPPKHASLNTIIVPVFLPLCTPFLLAFLFNIKFIKFIPMDIILYIFSGSTYICKCSEKDVKGYISYYNSDTSGKGARGGRSLG